MDRLFEAPRLPSAFEAVIHRIEQIRVQLEDAIPAKTGRWARLLTRMTFARAIWRSNRMEGLNVTLDDAVAAVDREESITAQPQDWMALVGYREALDYIFELSSEPSTYEISQGTLLALHHIMMRYDPTMRPGRWRITPTHVRVATTREIVYDPPPPSSLPGLMQAYIEQINKPIDRNGYVAAAISHLNLTMIHPFRDGNGRMARAIQTMVLARGGISNAVFSSIEEYIGSNTSEYYTVLAEVGKGRWQPENNTLPWIKFCLRAHYIQAATLQRRFTQLLALIDALESHVSRIGLHGRVISALIDAANGLHVRNVTYRKQVDVSDQVAKLDLIELVNHGFLEAKGEKRWRHYDATEKLREIVKSTRPRVANLDPFETIDRESKQVFVPTVTPFDPHEDPRN